MVEKLKITLLSSPGITLDDQPVRGFISSKAQALVYYLAATGRGHTREALAALLWSETPDPAARKNLRDVLSNLRRLLDPYLNITGQTVSLNPERPSFVDSLAFSSAVSVARQAKTALWQAELGAQLSLAEAVALYKGDFLAGFYVPDAPLFDEWVTFEREGLRLELQEALERLVNAYHARGDYKSAIRFGQRWVSLDPLSEVAHRYLIQSHASSGDHAAALRQYLSCARILEEELNIQPDEETVKLYERIRSADSAASLPKGQDLVVRGYELRECIGQGTFGAVYRAYQHQVRREVAIKVILPRYANQPDFIRRFEVEAQMVAKLEHPFTVPLYDFWREPGGAYLVMRFLQGGNLKASLKNRPMPVEAAIQLVDQISSALALAHQQQIIHRDIKPANILLDIDGNAYLSDFGIAAPLDMPGEQGRNMFTASSPEYSSPEQILGERITHLTDIYSLGIVIYELLIGEHPFPSSSEKMLENKHLREPLPSVRQRNPELPLAVDQVIQLATAKNPFDRFQDVQGLAQAFRQSLYATRLEDLPLATVQPATELSNPYKGLRAFSEADAADFFGREELVDRLVKRLSNSDSEAIGGLITAGRMLVLVGPSGIGKSSVVRAGLIPALRQGALPGSEKWFIVQMSPSSHPMDELQVALSRIAAHPLKNLLALKSKETDEQAASEQNFINLIQQCLPDPAGQILLFIDQFEEVFTLAADEQERSQFLRCLFTAVTTAGCPLNLVITLRADFYDRPLVYPGFGALVSECIETILPPLPDELSLAIMRPAERSGVRLETGLEPRIIADVIDQPGALPLLQYTLTELFENRSGDLLTLRAYQQIGGVRGALGRRAEQLYQSLDIDGQCAARQLFLRLVKLGVGMQETRKRLLHSELDRLAEHIEPALDAKIAHPSGQPDRDYLLAMETVIERFGQARLLTFDRDPVTRIPTIELAHEALLSEWDRLRAWLDSSREDLRQQQRLNAVATEWIDAGKNQEFLLLGQRLEQMDDWANSTELALTGAEREYLWTSLALHRQQQEAERARRGREKNLEHRSRNLLRAFVAILILATLGALGLASLARRAQLTAEQQSQARATQQTIAEQQVEIATSRELAAFAQDNLEIDPERSVLLALQALSQAYTLEAENSLHKALQAMRVLFTLSGHQGPVHFVVFSPDGARLATSSADRSVKIWDATTGKEIQTLSGHSAEVFGLDFSSDGKHLATTGYDGTARVWDASSGKELLLIPAYQGEAVAIHFSPDGSRLVTNGLYDGVVKIWDASTGKLLLSFPTHQAPVWYVTYSPDGKLLATGSVDRTAKIWDALSGKELLTLRGHSEVVSRLAFSPDGKRLATSSHEIKIWDLASKRELLTLRGHTTLVLWVAYSPDGKRLATGSVDGKIIVWDANTGDELMNLGGHLAPVLGLGFSPDGARIASGSFDGTARIWDLSHSRELLTLAGHTGEVFRLDFHPDSKHLVTGSFDGTAKVWELITTPSQDAAGQELFSLGKPGDSGQIRAVAFSPNGRLLVTTSAAGTTTLWDAVTGEQLKILRGHAPGQTGETVYNGVVGIAFSPDGSRLATASDDLTARVWDTRSGKELLVLTGHGHAPTGIPPVDGVIGVAFHPTADLLATAGGDGTVRIWDVHTAQELLSLDAHPGSSVLNVAFSPDGATLASSGFDAIVRLWSISLGTTGQTSSVNVSPLFTLSGHTSTVFGLAFSPDGHNLASASDDGTIRIWEVSTGNESLTLSGLSTALLDVAFSPDGSYLAASGRDGTVRFFVLPIEKLTALAQNRLTRSLTQAECRQFLHMDSCP